MKKHELLDIITDLPANQREQLAAEVYKSLNAVEDDLNAGWIVEANNLMQGYEDTPPPVPGDPDFIDPEEETEPSSYKEEEQERITIDLPDILDKLFLHCRIDIARRDKRETIPGEEVFRKLREGTKQREKEQEELFGDLEPLRGRGPSVTAVQPLDDFRLHLTFEDGEQRIFDMKPYRCGMFSGLQDACYFSWIRVHWGGVRWPNGESLWAKLLYKKSKPADH